MKLRSKVTLQGLHNATVQVGETVNRTIITCTRTMYGRAARTRPPLNYSTALVCHNSCKGPSKHVEGVRFLACMEIAILCEKLILDITLNTSSIMAKGQ